MRLHRHVGTQATPHRKWPTLAVLSRHADDFNGVPKGSRIDANVNRLDLQVEVLGGHRAQGDLRAPTVFDDEEPPFAVEQVLGVTELEHQSCFSLRLLTADY